MYGGCYQSSLNGIFGLQKRILKSIFNRLKHSQVSDNFERLQLDTLFDLYFFELFTNVFQMFCKGIFSNKTTTLRGTRNERIGLINLLQATTVGKQTFSLANRSIIAQNLLVKKILSHQMSENCPKRTLNCLLGTSTRTI